MKKIIQKSAILSAAVFAGALGGCASPSSEVNRSLDSVHQPVVSQTHYVMDVESYGGGLAPADQQKLANWFDAMDVGYGDRVSIDDPAPYGNRSAYDSIAQLVANRGMVMSASAPITEGVVPQGNIRVVVSRSQASVPGCPDWSSSRPSNFSNATSSNYGCSINSNLAAMVADPQDLVKGARGSLADPVNASKAIKAYRDAEPTGKGGLKANGTQGGGN